MGKRSRDSSRSRRSKKEKKHKKDKKKDSSSRKHGRGDLPAIPQNIPYSDMNNPFNDTNLTETFVWEKKLKLEGKDGLSKRAIERMNREKVHRNVEEMEKLKRERDARQAAREDIEFIAREEEKRQNADWKRIENNFHLKQADMRSKIRIKEGRAMPIDLLMRYIAYGESDDKNGGQYEDFELEQPTKYIKNLDADQFEDLLADIKVSRRLEEGKHSEFWDDITTLVKFELRKLRNDREEENIHSNVKAGVLASFEKKSFAELLKMNREIVDRIKGYSRGVDVNFWEEVLDLLQPKMARTRLKELHTKKMKMRLEQIRAEQKKATEKHEKDHNMAVPSTSIKSENDQIKQEMEVDMVDESKLQSDNTLNKEDFDAIEAYDLSRPLPFTLADFDNLDDEQREQKWLQLNSVQLNRFVIENYNAGGYSPSYLDESKAMPGIEVLDGDEDVKRLRTQRMNKGKQTKDEMSLNETRMMEIAKMGMGGDESSFAVEETIDHQDLLWSDKFRPQKPKYFNRVHTGFDWNKYNQTHYDMDNPPPKIVQGYRFNIFYPDLLDITKTPSFTLNECNDDPDFAILRFKAGPPYEDIAFKIVHREWEVNHKQGYKCQFSGGVFQLWFFFKRYRYRR